MVKQILLATIFSFIFGSTTLVYGQTSVKPATVTQVSYKFLDEITVEPYAEAQPAVQKTTGIPTAKREFLKLSKSADGSVEAATALQFKYALLLDIEVELLKNIDLLNIIDDWYGTRYSYGGTTKRGIDCSALMQVFFTTLYGVALPRTARQQHQVSRQISRTELKEGDLLFFNTTGGISHVGMYLQNNKFVHASSSDGVTISDMFDPYYAARLVGVGRVIEEESTASNSLSTKP